MSYSAITYAQTRTALAARLYDSGKQFYSDAELKSYITESLQTFNALANFSRSEFVFQAQTGVTWYDLTDTANLPSTLRPFTATDFTILNGVEYHLLEPQTTAYPLAWGGSLQFDLTSILNAIQQVRDLLLLETGCTITQSLIAANPGRTAMADSVIDIRRLCWIPLGGGFTPNCLQSSDVWAAQSYLAGFPQQSNGYPSMFRRSDTPPLSFDVDIQPAVNGQYDALTVNSGGDLTTAASTLLRIPDDWAWAVKWGALAQLLGRDSAAADPGRAAYAAFRFKQGSEQMRKAPAVLAARIGNVPVTVEAITAADSYRANWQGLTAGAPDAIYYAGMNLVALAPAPDSAPYEAAVSVVQNMPVPASDTDYLQVGREDIAAVLDYAQHLALFKCGGQEFFITKPLYENFMRRAALYNAKLAAESPFAEQIFIPSREDRRLNPDFAVNANG